MATDRDALMKLMERAVELAERGSGLVEPNPRVGALVVRDGEIVAEGWHRFYGGPHAEIDALQSAGEAARGAELVQTLEPCRTTGKTPPCTEAIRAAGITRVVYACQDPNPKNHGASPELEAAGISVEYLPHAAAEALLVPFKRWLDSSLPWVVLKWAMSADGKVATATGESRWISGDPSRREVHEERARSDAIMVGRATVKADDPLLNVRAEDLVGADPVRVVLDSGLHLEPDSRIVQTASEQPTWVFHCGGPDVAERKKALEDAGVRTFSVRGGEAGRLDPAEALETLRKEGLHRILVEGGPTVHGALLTAGLGCYARVYVSPLLIGGITAPGPVAGAGFPTLEQAVRLGDARFRRVGDDPGDVVLEGYIDNRRDSAEP